MKMYLLLFFILLFSSLAYASILDRNSGMTWTINHVQEDTYLNTNITIHNDTTLELNVTAKQTLPGYYRWHMALCNISNVNSLYYQNEDAQGEFNYSVSLSVNYGYLPNYGLPINWCNDTGGYGYILFANGARAKIPLRIRLLFEEIKPLDFKLYTGDSTSIVDASAQLLATAYPPSENLVKISNGTLYAGWTSSGDDLWFGASGDNGSTWSIKEIAGVFFGFKQAGILADSKDTLYLYYIDQSFAPNVLSIRNSTDGGSTWGTVHNMILAVNRTSVTYSSAVIDSTDTIHACGIVGDGGGKLRYYNGSDDTNYTINADTNDDSDFCDIAVDSKGNVCIGALGTDGKDIDVFCNTDGWTRHSVKENVIGAMGVPSIAYSPVLTVDNDDMFYIAYVYAPALGSDLYMSNFTASNLNAFDDVVVDTGNSYFPDIAISSQKDIHLLYTQGSTFGSGSIIYKSYKHYDSSTWTIRVPIANGSGYPSIRDSRYPLSNKMTNRVDYLYTNATAMVFFNNYTISYPSCFPEPNSNWNVYIPDNCTNTIPRDIRPYNFTAYGSSTITGYFKTTEQINTTNVILDYALGYTLCDLNCFLVNT